MNYVLHYVKTPTFIRWFEKNCKGHIFKLVPGNFKLLDQSIPCCNFRIHFFNGVSTLGIG